MSRIRSIHAAFFGDDEVTKVSAFGRLLLIGLWTQSDDHGVFEWKPGEIKKSLFPDQPIEIEPLLRELLKFDRVRSFEVDGRRYGVARNFGEYQKPKRPSYRYPLPAGLAGYAGFKEGQPPGKGKGSATFDASMPQAAPANDATPPSAPPATDMDRTMDRRSDVSQRCWNTRNGEETTAYQSSAPPHAGGRGEPPPLGEERRGREERESSVRSSPDAARDIGASDRRCRELIAAFDAAIVAEWGPMAARMQPNGRDYPTARGWLEGGADAALVAEVARKAFTGMHQRNFVPKLLKVIDAEMRAALADRMQIRRDGKPDIERDRWAPQMMAWERGTWLPNWGEPPGSPGCPMPKRLQDECLAKRAA